MNASETIATWNLECKKLSTGWSQFQNDPVINKSDSIIIKSDQVIIKSDPTFDKS